MWLVVILIASIIVTVLFFKIKSLKKYRLDFLALMLWGAFIMTFIDHLIAFISNGGDFIDFTTDGLIPNSILLGFLMIIPLLAAWIVFYLVQNKYQRYFSE